MYYLVYKITNLVNKKYYIGVRKTSNKDDGYMGSGKLIRKAIAKYGLENFKKEILFEFNNPNDMFDMERELVTEAEVNNYLCYNLKIGGYGGWDHIDNEKHNKKINANRNYNDPIFKDKLSKSMKNAMKVRMDNGEIPFNGCRGFSKNHTHSEETKRKISLKNKGRQSSTKGRIWIHHLEFKKAKMIFPHELNEFLNQGWLKGNKRKF